MQEVVQPGTHCAGPKCWVGHERCFVDIIMHIQIRESDSRCDNIQYTLGYIKYGLYPSRGGYCQPTSFSTFVMAGAAEARRESFWAQPQKTGSSFTCSETLPGWDKCILSTLWCTLRWWNQWHSNHRGFQNFGMSAVPQCSTCLLEYQTMFGSEPQIYYDLLPGFWPIAISLVIHGGFQRRIDPNHSSHGWPAACLETSMVTTGDPFKDHMYQDAFMYIYIYP